MLKDTSFILQQVVAMVAAYKALLGQVSKARSPAITTQVLRQLNRLRGVLSRIKKRMMAAKGLQAFYLPPEAYTSQGKLKVSWIISNY